MRTSLMNFDQIKYPSQLEQHSLALFQYQYNQNPVYRSYCDLINVAPSDVKKLNDIPFLPIQFFKSHTVSCKQN